MSLLLLGAYRLFAGSRGLPRRSFNNRAAIFCIIVTLIAYLITRFCPTLAPVEASRAAALMGMTILVITTMVFICTSYVQRAAALKLYVFSQLPVRSSLRYALAAMAYTPVVFLSFGLVMSCSVALFNASLAVPFIIVLASLFLGVAAAWHVLVRMTRSALADAVRPVSFLVLAVGLEMGWGIVGGTSTLYVYGALLAYALLMCSSLWLLRKPLLCWMPAMAQRIVREHRLLSMTSALYVRARRAPRYIGANVILVILLAASVALAWYKPGMSFVGASSLVLLLGGTLGQEIRAMSPRVYPLELLLYGRVRKWVSALWIVGGCNAAFFTALTVIVALLWFPHDVGVGYMQMLSTGVCLIAVGLLAGSLIVPVSNDILMQMVSTILYGALCWAVLYVMAGQTVIGQWMVAATVLSGAAVVAYGVEMSRWLRTIRGKYAIS